MEQSDSGSIRLPEPSDPDAALAAVVTLRAAADRLEHAAVFEAVAQGWTWTAIAQSLGVTRQAVHKRHRKRVEAALKIRNRDAQEN